MVKSTDVSVCIMVKSIAAVLLSTLLKNVASVRFIEEPADFTKAYTYGSAGTVQSVFLDCQVDSLEPNQQVSWIKNGVIISDNYDFRQNVKHAVDERYRIILYNIPNRFTLQVWPVSSSTVEFDSGSYKCVVISWQNNAIVLRGLSRTATVNIYITPTSNYPVCQVHDSSGEVTSTSSTVNVESSVKYTLVCLSGQSTPIVTLFWSRNGQSLQWSSNWLDSEGFFYTTYNWTPYRADTSTVTFTCTLQHAGLSFDRKCSLYLNVQYAPIVTIDPTDITVTEHNDDIVLHCNQDANPQVTEPIWYYDSDLVSSGGRFTLEGISLRLSTFSSSDNGDHTVTCELTNVIGTGSESVTLTVNIPTPSPKVTLPPSPKVTLPRTASSGITVPDNDGRTTVAANNKSHSTDPFAIPRKTNNTGIIIGSVVGICLLIDLIITSVILICLKTRRKSSQSPKSNFDAQRAESGRDVIGVAMEDKMSPRYESTNGAFGNEYSDIALNLARRWKQMVRIKLQKATKIIEVTW